MSLAIEWGGGVDTTRTLFVYFDAVTSYSKEYKGKITEHPIDGGSSIADHFIRYNPKITFTGIVSGADIYNNSGLSNKEGVRPKNTKAAPNAVAVNSATGDVLPTSLSQLFSPRTPSSRLDDPTDSDVVGEVKQAIEEMVAGENLGEAASTSKQKIRLANLYEYYEGNQPKSKITNLVATSVLFKEDADSGDALVCEITLERLTFTSSQTVQLSKDVSEALLTKAAEAKNKGKQDSTETELDVVDEEGGTLLLRLGRRSGAEARGLADQVLNFGGE